VGGEIRRGLDAEVANGIDLEWNVSQARATNLEFQVQPSLWAHHETTVRFLSFLNRADMGIYRDANNAFLEGRDPEPDIEAHRQQGRKKYGFGINGEEQLTHDIRLYGRAGWNEGAHESFAYTEVDRGASFGGSVQGSHWKRANDKTGATFVVNSISGDHRRYLQLGGNGFLLGDGDLSYGLEKIFETYYTARAVRGVYLAFDLQHINNPGYNQDRGPVLVLSARLHLEF
jgi:carbohydrate-selective porin OprB